MRQLLGYIRCRCCSEWSPPTFDWGTVLTVQEESLLCEKCEDILREASLRDAHTCEGCGKLLKEKTASVCVACVARQPLICNTSLFAYTPAMKEWVTMLKFRGDIMVATIFHASVQRAIKESKMDLVVPVPSSAERLKERGCNIVEELVPKSVELYTCLGKHHQEKQSKKTKKERLETPTPFYWNMEANILKGKKILLIDDIYTTGTTVAHAASLLQENGAIEVRSLTVWRG